MESSELKVLKELLEEKLPSKDVLNVRVRPMVDADGNPAFRVVLVTRAALAGPGLAGLKRLVHEAVRETGSPYWPYTRFETGQEQATA